MSDQEDLELQALQRQLDDAFETTRPRRGFEDELWLRIQARRPLGGRMRDAMLGLLGGIREAPAVPLAAVAILLVVIVGVGIVGSSGLRFGHSSEASSALGPGADRALAARLPSPALHPGLAAPPPDSTASGGLQPAPAAASNVYYGPATLSWAGQLPAVQVQAPVFSYSEPGLSAADQFAASIGASTTKSVRQVNGYLGTYAGLDFIVSVRGSIPQLPEEPGYLLTSKAASGAQGTDAQAAAVAFLSRFSLVPSGPGSVTVQQSGDQARVMFLRAFDLPGGGIAYLVDWNGERHGVEVDIRNGQAVAAGGPLPLSLGSATYPLISNDQAVQLALTSAPASTAVISPTPVVKLDKVELVYALAISGRQGFYEPAYLFSGTFQYGGQTYVKRVLVPLVEPSLRSS